MEMVINLSKSKKKELTNNTYYNDSKLFQKIYLAATLAS
jgi:hypothetical protein